MKKQLIVTISREYGSAGHFIAERIAKKLDIALYDKSFFINAHDKIGYSAEIMEKYDEKPINFLLSRRVGEHSNSIERHVQQKVDEFLLSKANSGESFVVVGRCADNLLRDNPNAVRIFVLADEEEKIHRIMEIYNLSREKAIDKMRRHDKKRKSYHNTYCDIRWGDSRGYHLCVNSSLLGIDDTSEVICEYLSRFVLL